MADHNDPNAVNSIFSDVDVSAADVYDMFGYPSDATDEEKAAIDQTIERGSEEKVPVEATEDARASPSEKAS